jgi:hypothetical protein
MQLLVHLPDPPFQAPTVLLLRGERGRKLRLQPVGHI